MKYISNHDDFITQNSFDNMIINQSSEDLPWISEGTKPDNTHDIPSKPPQEIPTHQPPETQPTPQEITQYHSIDD